MNKKLLALFTILVSIQSYATIIYVNPTSSGNNDGTSWNDAYTDIQVAFNNLTPGANDSVFVAEGTYNPSGIATGQCIEILETCSVFGGFPVTGNPTISDRDWNTYITYFDGDLNGDDVENDLSLNKADNAGRILCANAATERITIDGIFFKNGGNGSNGNPPGISSTSFLHLYNCRFEDNINSTNFGVIRLSQAAGDTDSSYFYNTHFYNNLTSNANHPCLVAVQHDAKAMFEKCTFNNSIGGFTEIWAVGSENIEFNNCVFSNRMNQALNIVNDISAITAQDSVYVDINHCTFYNVDQPFYNWFSSTGTFNISNTFFDFYDSQNAYFFRDGSGSNFSDSIICVIDSVACSSDSLINTANNNISINGNFLLGTFDYETKDTLNSIYKLDCSNEFTDRGFLIPSITEDIEGNNRVIGDAPDLGAYESDCPSTASIKEEDIADFILIPNPATDMIAIQYEEEIDNIEIISATGRVMEAVISSENQIDISNYPTGFYFVKVFSNRNIVTKKLIKK
jgi:hypothetical protein